MTTPLVPQFAARTEHATTAAHLLSEEVGRLTEQVERLRGRRR
ncbi:hypothetical protein [Sanguibacter sp. 26GB23]